MEIPNTYYKRTRMENDCYTYDYVYLVKLDSYLYNVIHTKAVEGSRTDNTAVVTGESFNNYDSANNYMISLTSVLEKF